MSGWFAETPSQIVTIFGKDSGLQDVVWQGRPDQLVPDAASVDVVLSSEKTVFLQKMFDVALVQWPKGPVIRRFMYQQGTSVTLGRVPVRPGEEFAVVSSLGKSLEFLPDADSLPARVELVAVGKGAALEEQRREETPDSPAEQLMRLLEWVPWIAGGGLAIGLVVLGLIYLPKPRG